jgi:hypothetical protein
MQELCKPKAGKMGRSMAQFIRNAEDPVGRNAFEFQHILVAIDDDPVAGSCCVVCQDF